MLNGGGRGGIEPSGIHCCCWFMAPRTSSARKGLAYTRPPRKVVIVGTFKNGIPNLRNYEFVFKETVVMEETTAYSYVLVRMRLVLVALLACVHTRASPLTKSAASFKACAVGKGDVDVSAFADATLAYCALLRRFGVFTAGSIRQVLLCIDKVEGARPVSNRPKHKKASLVAH